MFAPLDPERFGAKAPLETQFLTGPAEDEKGSFQKRDTPPALQGGDLTGFAFINARTMIYGIIALVVAAGLGIGILKFAPNAPGFPGNTPASSSQVPGATSTPEASTSARVSSVAGLTYTGEPVAALRIDPEFVKTLPPGALVHAQQELAGLALKLAKDPLQSDLWRRVAYLKHFFNDDAGAADAYEFIKKITYNDPVSAYNLALIYAYNLGEPAKAIPNYQAAIAIDPHNASFWIGLADFYREVERNVPAAEKTLLEAHQALAHDASILAALASVEKDLRHVDKAIQYYEEALAQSNLTAEGRASIQAEIDALKRELPAS